MNINKAITYSLLSHIRSSHSVLLKGPLDVFIPLIKRVLSKMNQDGIYRGKSISEIKTYSDKLYSFDFPLPVLEKILKLIEEELNSDQFKKFSIHNDKSFSINEYVFTEFEDEIRKHQQEVENLQRLFQNFCTSSGFDNYKELSVFDFIEKSKLNLSKYLANKEQQEEKSYSVEAQFIEYFRQITPVYEFIKKIYLGSVISSYIEYKTVEASIDVELLLDTNFVIAALDLNTPESTHTCQTLLKIAMSQGYKCKIMDITIEEIKSLLQAKSDNFNNTFLSRIVYPEDVYNACERRKLNKADLERIIDNLENEILSLEVQIIYNTTKYQNLGKFSTEYKTLKEYRNTEKAALHDATAIQYVKEKRGKKIYEFDKVNCWFVNNSISREGSSNYNSNGTQPEIIKADDLLNILWLSNPQSRNEISDQELTDIGLSSLISLALNKDLPKTSVIRELDDNIHKYSNSEISDTDVLRIATRITSKQLRDVEEINELANNNKEQFVQRLKEEAKKQEQIENRRLKMLEEAVTKLSEKAASLDKIKDRIEKDEKNTKEQHQSLISKVQSSGDELIVYRKNLLQEQNKNREVKRKEFYKKELTKWRKKSWMELSICIVFISFTILYLFWSSDWNIQASIENIKQFRKSFWIGLILPIIGLIFSKTVFDSLVNKYRNPSYIENYKKGLSIPDDCVELTEPIINP